MHWIYLKNISFALLGALVISFMFLSFAPPTISIGWAFLMVAIWGVHSACKLICEFEQHENNKKKRI
jgi:hypothetical protein